MSLKFKQKGSKHIKYIEVSTGDTFEYGDKYYLETDMGGEYRCVSLSTGRTFHVEDEEKVCLCDIVCQVVDAE